MREAKIPIRKNPTIFSCRIQFPILYRAGARQFPFKAVHPFLDLVYFMVRDKEPRVVRHHAGTTPGQPVMPPC